MIFPVKHTHLPCKTQIFPPPQHKPPAGNRHYHKENRNNKGPDTTAAAYGNKNMPDKKIRNALQQKFADKYGHPPSA